MEAPSMREMRVIGQLRHIAHDVEYLIAAVRAGDGVASCGRSALQARSGSFQTIASCDAFELISVTGCWNYWC